MPKRARDPDWPRLMSVDTACAYLGMVAPDSFLEAVAPRLHAIRLPGGVVRFDRKELDAWVDGRGSLPQTRGDADWLNDVANAKD